MLDTESPKMNKPWPCSQGAVNTCVCLGTGRRNGRRKTFLFLKNCIYLMSVSAPHFPHLLNELNNATALCVSRSVVSDPLWPHGLAHQAPLSMGILQARISEWAAKPSCRRSSQPRGRTQVSHIAGRFFTVWATREAQWLFFDKYLGDTMICSE